MFTRKRLVQKINKELKEEAKDRKARILAINNEIGCPLFDQPEYHFFIDSSTLSNKKMVSKSIDHIFESSPGLQKPNTLTNDRILKESIEIEHHNEMNNKLNNKMNNKIFVSLRPKKFHSLYCLKILGLKSEEKSVHYIGSSMETFGKVIKIIHHNGYDTHGIFMFNGKEIDENNSLKEQDFIEGSVNEIQFTRTFPQ